MNKSAKILKSREEKVQEIKKIKKNFKTVISVKSNIPGNNKNIKVAYGLSKYFSDIVSKRFSLKSEFFDTDDGPYYLLSTNQAASGLKQEFIDIEDTHELGRFIDLDVYGESSSISRKTMRKCYLCNDFAINCIRRNKHSKEELLSYINDNVCKYFTNLIKNLIDYSIMNELDLNPKFGLVTPHTSGSHIDMNYQLMIKAKNAIIPFFVKMFFVGWNERIEDIFSRIRSIGIEAESHMLKETDGINAYKGLIFNLGITVSAYGYTLSNNIEDKNLFDIIKVISSDVLKDFNNNDSTFGFEAYRKYNITGARGEVFNGIPNVKKALSYLNDFSDKSRLRTLMFLISETEDTVLLKRSMSFTNYQDIKKRFKNSINDTEDKIVELNDFCINQNLSFGGSADLLIITIFLAKIGL